MKRNQHTRAKLIHKLKHYLDISNGNDTDLANRLGTTSQKRNSWRTKIANWKRNSGPLSDTEILNLIRDITEASAKEIYKGFTKQIVEYFPIEKVVSRGGKKYEISPPHDMRQRFNDLRKRLEKTKTGIYIFYDSSGRAIYVGKTEGETDSLWGRMKGSFNQNQQKSRKIYGVNHSSNTKVVRKLEPQSVQLHELAKYFSAYQTHPEMTHNIEALLIRAFADNLMNKRMENFKN
ncbi:MAG: hypothetical protein OXG54_06840 [Gammaproteobacteria bacterium]|nr:hypothetical protein [Gammaproteobacteria bacterium]